VYVEEVPPGRPGIETVDPSVTAMVGSAHAGPVDEVVLVSSAAQAADTFGSGSWLAVAVADHLASGGRTVLAVRGSTPAAGLAALEGRGVRLLVVESDAAAACTWCAAHRAFLVTDADPGGLLPAGLGRDAAAYHPPLLGPDGPVRPCAPAVSGVIVHIDQEHGVWRPPAGTAAVLPFALAETGVAPDHLAEHGVNALRVLGGHSVVWGARTAAWQDPQWRYVNVRRTVLTVEETLEHGLAWVAFEPNAEPLWAEVRAAVEGFLLPWWRHGALSGSKRSEAFFVRCDRSTTTEADVAAGRLVLEVGLALLSPAEFVVLRVALRTAMVT
jgi:phage tail sheath protein FI